MGMEDGDTDGDEALRSLVIRVELKSQSLGHVLSLDGLV